MTRNSTRRVPPETIIGHVRSWVRAHRWPTAGIAVLLIAAIVVPLTIMLSAGPAQTNGLPPTRAYLSRVRRLLTDWRAGHCGSCGRTGMGRNAGCLAGDTREGQLSRGGRAANCGQRDPLREYVGTATVQRDRRRWTDSGRCHQRNRCSEQVGKVHRGRRDIERGQRNRGRRRPPRCRTIDQGSRSLIRPTNRRAGHQRHRRAVKARLLPTGSGGPVVKSCPRRSFSTSCATANDSGHAESELLIGPASTSTRVVSLIPIAYRQPPADSMSCFAGCEPT